MTSPIKALFASSGDGKLTDDEFILKMAERVVGTGMSVPAVLFLEMGKPLSYISSQAMVFFAPIATALFPGDGYNRLSRLLEDRENVDRLMRKIEQLEDEGQRKSKEARKNSPKKGLFSFMRRSKPKGGDSDRADDNRSA